MKENSSLCVGFRSWSFAMLPWGFSQAAHGFVKHRKKKFLLNVWNIPVAAFGATTYLVSARHNSFMEAHVQSVKFSSVVQSCPILCDPMECSIPGLLIPHHLPKFAQVHVHCISDAIQPPLLWYPPLLQYIYNTECLFLLYAEHLFLGFNLLLLKS